MAVCSILALLLCACEQKPTPPAASPASKPTAPTPAAPAKPIAPAPTPTPPPAAPADPKTVADTFPSGQSTPEGVACDLVRAYANADGKLFRASCFVITPGTPERDAYNNFLDQTVTLMDIGNAVPSNNRDWPASIQQLYGARNLSNPAPAAFGLDQHGLTAVRFVDLRVTLRSGTTTLRRTLVVQDEGSQLWSAIPRPDLFLKLSEGLNEEPESTEPWKP
jgi:hypothetical protein